jgi:hypothetical protein
MFILPSSLGLFAALHAGALIILFAAEIIHDTGLGAAALKAFERIVERFVLLDMDFRHSLFPPPEYASRCA